MKRSILVAPSLLALMLVLSACGGLSEAEQHNSAGVELAEQGQLNEAIAEFGEALRLDPQYTKAYYYRGLAYQHLGRVHQAIQDYGDALRLDAPVCPCLHQPGQQLLGPGAVRAGHPGL